MKALALAALFPLLTVNASTLAELKTTPASKYDVGKLQLELTSFIFGDRLKGEHVKGTNFKIKGFDVEEDNFSISLKMSLTGRAKELTQEKCEQMSGFTNKIFPKEKLMKEFWPGLTEVQYQALSHQFQIKTELVSKENENFKISC